MTRSHRAVVLACACAGVMSVVAVAGAQATAGAGQTIVVIPFDNARLEPGLAWLREGTAVLLSELLVAGGQVVIDREERLRAFERLQLPAAASLSRASAIKVGHALGASVVVFGSVEGAGDQVTLRARLIQLETGRLMPEARVQGALADLYGVFGRLAAALTGGGTPPMIGDRLPPSSPVFELFVKGLVADTPSASLAFFEQVLKAAPAYDRARLAVWRVRTDAGEYQGALDAVLRIRPDSRVSREGRFLGALSLISLKRFDEALQVLRAMQSEAPAAAVANALGVVELRRAATPAPGRATYYFSQASEIDPSDGNLFFNLGYAYWIEHDARATIYWLREAVRRDPGDGDAHFILGAALQQTGAAAEAGRERELATRLASKYATWESRAGGGDPVPRGLERLDDSLVTRRGLVDSMVMASGLRDQDALAQFHLEAGARAFAREADREAIQELRRALYLSPYLAEAHLWLGRLFLRGGRAEDAIEELKIALWSEETVEGHLALAEAYLQAHDRASARTEVDRALALDPASGEARRLQVRIAAPP